MGVRSLYHSLTFGVTVSLAVSSIGGAQSVTMTTASARASAPLITVDVDNVPLAGALEIIARRAGLRPAWDDGVFAATSRVTLHVKDVTIDEAFTKALAGTGMQAKFMAKRVEIVRDLAIGAAARTAAQGVIVGNVRDAKTKMPLGGVTVFLDDAKKGVKSGDDGKFRMTNVTAGAHMIRVRLLGYERASKTVTVVEGETITVDVALTPSVNTLDQVVVTGTVVPTELKAVPNAITIITGKELEEKNVTRIYELFRGNVPGFFTSRTGQQGAIDPGKVGLVSRGSSMLDELGAGTVQLEGVKTYVDGVELADKQYLGMIDPKSIERIEILTGPQASTIYGSNAINGVIQIFTKRGKTTRPELMITLRSAWTQNNFSSGLAPNHDDAASITGMEGRLSYNLGTTWNYQGSWVPQVLGQTASGYGGGRVTVGPLTVDASLRQMRVQNKSGGRDGQVTVERGATGEGKAIGSGLPDQNIGTSADNQVGMTATYAMTPWWSHAVTLGGDRLMTASQQVKLRFWYPDDSLRSMSQQTVQRLTAAYTTTLRVPLRTMANALVTFGANESHLAEQDIFGAYNMPDKSGFYGNSFGQSRMHGAEHGGFMDAQLGVWDAVFVTYGLRAVYNPNIGAQKNPNLEPKYGIAMTREFGNVTVKARGSYGRSTRPPTVGQKDGLRMSEVSPLFVFRYGDTWYDLPNPDLVPESNAGGEGGLEVYVGSLGSLVITRFNQTIDNLIQLAYADSVDRTPAYKRISSARCAVSFGCPFRQPESLNLGSIRNQGWEATGTLNFGPLTTHETYSWTKSRLIGITPKYRRQFPQYVVGSPYALVPEHTYAVDIAYTRGGTHIGWNLQGQGLAIAPYDPVLRTELYDTRLMNVNPRIDIPNSIRGVFPGFPLSNLNISHQFTTRVEALLDITNVTNSYKGDVDATVAQAGRTTGIGVRIHL